jgi:hypothetical protein
MNKMNEKKNLWATSLILALERKGLSMGRRQNGSFNHVALKGINFLAKKGRSCLKE